MFKDKIKSSELVIIKKILAWQTAQVLGFEDEKTIKKHALLLAVDYEENSYFPLMTGEYFDIYINEDYNTTWTSCYTYIVNNYVMDNHDNALIFFGEKAAEEKWKKGIEFDSFDFISTIDGQPKWTHSVQHLFYRDGHLHAIYWFVEIEQFHQNRNAISFLAEHDALTGLYNRHKLISFENELKSKTDNQSNIYYILIDLDNFKQVNDKYGHNNGDKVLIKVAKSLESIFFHKTNNLVFRYGGDEFLIITRNVDEQDLIPLLIDANKPIEVVLDDGSTIKIQTSIGYSDTINKADEALYYVKNNGRNSYHKS